jgi:hypothetical protein
MAFPSFLPSFRGGNANHFCFEREMLVTSKSFFLYSGTLANSQIDFSVASFLPSFLPRGKRWPFLFCEGNAGHVWDHNLRSKIIKK